MDANRVAGHHCWAAMVELVGEHPDIGTVEMAGALPGVGVE
ncbi:hypothetical protein [Mycolicibacterium alvei]|jgi:hypothetical protein|nr:hypothetical protein [Mycolicibacterium alvei]